MRWLERGGRSKQPLRHVPLPGMALRDSAIHDPATEVYWSTSTLFAMIIELAEADTGTEGKRERQLMRTADPQG